MLQIAVIAVAFFAGDRILAMMADGIISHSSSAPAMTYGHRLDHEIWIAGNSRAKKSFSSSVLTKLTGERTINLGTNGIRPEILHAMLTDAIASNPLPKTVIIEVSYLKNPWDDSQGGEFLPFIHHGEETSKVLHRRLAKEATATDILHLRRYGGQQFFLALAHLSKDDQSPTSRSTISEDAITALKQREQIRFPLREEDTAALKLLIENFESKQVNVELVLAPFYGIYCDQIIDLEGWVQRIENAVGKPVHNHARTIRSTEFFGDHVHFNRTGQEKFTRIFSDQTFGVNP